MNKKAIEPLIATILLVVIAVILVVIVLAWGRDFTGEGLNKVSGILDPTCDEATIAISNCDYNDAENTITFFIKNTSNSYVFSTNAFVANIIDDSNALNNALDTSVTSSTINPGASALGQMSTTLSATRVTVAVRSSACPNIATDTVKNCQ